MKTIGGYVLEEKLGRGAMGVIWRASHSRFPGHAFAVKLMARGAASDAMRARFRQELTALERVTAHPNVVRVLGGGTEGETLYYVMELVEGRGLQDVVEKEGPLEPRRAAAIMRDAAAALAHVHACDVIHRDVKPDNILLDAEDQVRVCDFGLARVEGAQSLTQTGAIVGTPLYASPEALHGSGGRDPRSDIWGLGAVLFFLLYGRPPFEAKNLDELMKRVAADPPERPSNADELVPSDLDAIVHRALAKKPLDRYQSATDLRHDLERFLAGEPIAPSPKARAPWIAVAVLVFVVGATGAALGRRTQGEPRTAGPRDPDDRSPASLKGKPDPDDASVLEHAYEASLDAAARDRALGVALEHSAVFATAPRGALATVVAFANGNQSLRDEARRALLACESGSEVARAMAAADELAKLRNPVILAEAHSDVPKAAAQVAAKLAGALGKLAPSLRARTAEAILAPVWASEPLPVGRLYGARTDPWTETLDDLANHLRPEEVPPEHAAIRLFAGKAVQVGANGHDRRDLERLLDRLEGTNTGLAAHVAYRLALLDDMHGTDGYRASLANLERGEALAARPTDLDRPELELFENLAIRRLSMWPPGITRETLLEIATTPRGARLAAANFLNRNEPVPAEILERLGGTIFEAESLRQRGELDRALDLSGKLDSSEAAALRALVHNARGETDLARAEAARMARRDPAKDALIFALEKWTVDNVMKGIR